MPNLKDIRRRIKSVHSTKKITQAMKMVAAAKVKRAENKVKANRPYATALRDIFRDVYESMKNQVGALDGSRYGELLRERPIKNLGVLVITGDRGLCGSYNASVIKQTLMLDKRFQEEGITPKFYLVGNKIIRGFNAYTDSEVLGTSGNISAAPTIQDANLVAKNLFDAYHAGEIDGIQILYTRFVSMISYKVTLKPIFPMKGLIDEIEHIIDPAQAHVRETEQETGVIRPETLLEPDPVQVLDTLIPSYLSNEIYNALLEGSASELAARMTAMSNASKNAGEMIDKLTLVYNKARQAAITQEILEIVSGAQALD